MTLVCDGCGTVEDVEIRQLLLGTARKPRFMESCSPCWAPVETFWKAGRPHRTHLEVAVS